MQLIDFNKYFRFASVLLAVFLCYNSMAQELSCNVTVNTSKIPGTNKQIFETLESALSNYMNNTVWTNHIFERNERIECNILLTVTEYESDFIQGSLQIQSRRPVYNSSYSTVMFNYVDNDIAFRYQEFDPIEHSENTFLSNLSSIFSFYAFIIIGLDYDSFSPEGGTPFFMIADKIANNAQSGGAAGWKGSDSKSRRNRYWLINNIIDKGFNPVRKFNYTYHIQGLDVMAQNIEKGRQVIFESISNLKKFNDNKPAPFVHYFNITISSKSDEFVQIFSNAPREQKTQVYNMLTTIDPSNQQKYESLKE